MCTPSTGAIVEGEREAKAKNPFCAIWHHFPLLSFRICQRKTERADGPTDGRTTVMLAAAAAAADIACKMKNRARIADRPDPSDERRRPNRDAKNDEVLSKNGLTFGESRRSGCHGHGEYMRTCMKTLPR